VAPAEAVAQMGEAEVAVVAAAVPLPLLVAIRLRRLRVPRARRVPVASALG